MQITASLLVAFSLLTPAATAHADGAWLLWTTYMVSRTEPQVTTTTHEITRAFDSQGACERAIPNQARSHIQTWSSVYELVNISPGDPAVVTAKSHKGSASKDDSLIVRVSCWPIGLEPKDISGRATYAKRGAWVVWKEVSRPAGPDVWLLYEGHDSKADCEAETRTYVQSSLKRTDRPGTTREFKNDVIITRERDTGKEIQREEFHCFPSGTDPRPR